MSAHLSVGYIGVRALCTEYLLHEARHVSWCLPLLVSMAKPASRSVDTPNLVPLWQQYELLMLPCFFRLILLLIFAGVCVGMLGCAVSPLSSCPCRVTRPSYQHHSVGALLQQRLWLQLSCVTSPETLNSLISVWKSNTHPRPQCEVFYDRY